MLDELDGARSGDGVKELWTMPGPPQVHVLMGDDILTPGDPLGTNVPIGGKIRQVIWPAGTNTGTGLTPFVESGG